MDEFQQAQPLKTPGDKSNQKALMWTLAGLLIVALLAIAWLVWQWMMLNQQITDLKNQNQQLEARILELSESTTPAEEETSAACDPTVTAELKANIADAVNSGNYAALEGYMTDSVSVILAASEGIGPQTPADAVASMAYLDGGSAPWDFNFDPTAIAAWEAGFYTDYFDDNTVVGVAGNGMVVVFDFDECGKINEVFMVANAELLL